MDRSLKHYWSIDHVLLLLLSKFKNFHCWHVQMSLCPITYLRQSLSSFLLNVPLWRCCCWWRRRARASWSVDDHSRHVQIANEPMSSSSTPDSLGSHNEKGLPSRSCCWQRRRVRNESSENFHCWHVPNSKWVSVGCRNSDNDWAHFWKAI